MFCLLFFLLVHDIKCFLVVKDHTWRVILMFNINLGLMMMISAYTEHIYVIMNSACKHIQ